MPSFDRQACSEGVWWSVSERSANVMKPPFTQRSPKTWPFRTPGPATSVHDNVGLVILPRVGRIVVVVSQLRR